MTNQNKLKIITADTTYNFSGEGISPTSQVFLYNQQNTLLLNDLFMQIPGADARIMFSKLRGLKFLSANHYSKIEESDFTLLRAKRGVWVALEYYQKNPSIAMFKLWVHHLPLLGVTDQQVNILIDKLSPSHRNMIGEEKLTARDPSLYLDCDSVMEFLKKLSDIQTHHHSELEQAIATNKLGSCKQIQHQLKSTIVDLFKKNIGKDYLIVGTADHQGSLYPNLADLHKVSPCHLPKLFVSEPGITYLLKSPVSNIATPCVPLNLIDQNASASFMVFNSQGQIIPHISNVEGSSSDPIQTLVDHYRRLSENLPHNFKFNKTMRVLYHVSSIGICAGSYSIADTFNNIWLQAGFYLIPAIYLLNQGFIWFKNDAQPFWLPKLERLIQWVKNIPEQKKLNNTEAIALRNLKLWQAKQVNITVYTKKVLHITNVQDNPDIVLHSVAWDLFSINSIFRHGILSAKAASAIGVDILRRPHLLNTAGKNKIAAVMTTAGFKLSPFFKKSNQAKAQWIDNQLSIVIQTKSIGPEGKLLQPGSFFHKESELVGEIYIKGQVSLSNILGLMLPKEQLTKTIDELPFIISIASASYVYTINKMIAFSSFITKEYNLPSIPTEIYKTAQRVSNGRSTRFNDYAILHLNNELQTYLNHAFSLFFHGKNSFVERDQTTTAPTSKVTLAEVLNHLLPNGTHLYDTTGEFIGSTDTLAPQKSKSPQSIQVPLQGDLGSPPQTKNIGSPTHQVHGAKINEA